MTGDDNGSINAAVASARAALGIDVRSTPLATADESSNNSAHAVFWHV